MANNQRCDLEHERSAAAVIYVSVKSSRVGRPGHPMTRELALCARHARELRDFGVELIPV